MLPRPLVPFCSTIMQQQSLLTVVPHRRTPFAHRHLRVQQGCDIVTQLPCSCCLYHHVGEHLWIVPRWITRAYCLGVPVVERDPGTEELIKKYFRLPFMLTAFYTLDFRVH